MTLADYITRHLRVPFCFGKHDCCTFAGGWARQATGVDYLAEVGTWSTGLEAARKIRQAGGLEAILDSRFKRVEPSMAKDGDLALSGGRLCIFTGEHIVGPGETELIFTDRMEAQCAWSY